jgi:diguanylate cyclase (GGDEF)-like protein
MNTLLKDLAHLSGLRDRHAMDFALVTLMLHSKEWQFSKAKLLRAIGPSDDQRWVTLASLARGQAVPERDHVWLDLTHLPRMSENPQREATIVTESVVHSGSVPFTTCFPIDTQASVCSLLEVESDVQLSTGNETDVDSVLRLYENLQSMLDYGEKDTLTELLNRKTFDTAFWRAAQTQDTSQEISHAERRNQLPQGSYWLAVIDIDNFKNVNDNFGHLIGDEVLLLLARQMRSSFRLTDKLYRFGGEEFVVLMRCADQTDAVVALERFRNQIENHSFPKVSHITISIGFTPLHENDTPSGAFDRADKAVYYAKCHGRNQVCNYTALVESGELVAPVEDFDEVDFF